MADSQLLMADRPVRHARRTDGAADAARTRSAWLVLAVLGWVIALIGWTDVALAWVPLRIGTPEWEFATVGATFAGMPLATLGLAAAAAGLIARGSRWPVRSLSVLAWLILAFVVAAYSLYLLDAPLAWRGVQEPLRPTLIQAFVKTSVFAAAYMALYTWLGWYAWRHSSGTHRGRAR